MTTPDPRLAYWEAELRKVPWKLVESSAPEAAPVATLGHLLPPGMVVMPDYPALAALAAERMRELEEALEAVIDHGDYCQGHRACAEPWPHDLVHTALARLPWNESK